VQDFDGGIRIEVHMLPQIYFGKATCCKELEQAIVPELLSNQKRALEAGCITVTMQGE
jgi:hypothetical protein